jgi:hypothetical protein
VACTGAADGGIEGVVDAGRPVVGGVPVGGVGFVGDGIAAIVNADTIEGVGATPSPPVVGAPGVARATVVVVPVLAVVVGALVVVVDDEGTLVVVNVLVVLVVVVVAGRIGRDSAWLRARSLPAHCVVPAWTTPMSRVVSTSLAVRLLGSDGDGGDSGVPPTVAVERCTANGPTGQSSICDSARWYVELDFDHNSSSEPSRVAAPVVVLTVPAKSLTAAACTVSIPSVGDGVATATSTSVNVRRLLGRV